MNIIGRNLRTAIALVMAFALTGSFVAIVSADKPVGGVHNHPNPLVVTVDVMPNTLNLKSNGRTVTVNTTVDGGGKTAEDLVASSVELEGLSSINTAIDNNGDSLITKYDRADFEDEVSPGDAVTVTVDGDFTDGDTFSETDDIRVID